MLKNFTIISLLLAALLFGSGFSSDSTLSVERNSSSNFLQTFKIERISEANLQYLIKRFSKELNIEEETIEEESSQEKPTDHQETEKNGGSTT
ncbi:hypothetical protein JCM21714_2262 [Gracilibacillus boraciitolerans JCM 21714]|uniref:Uncharacterized protein n=1 Tax=Gracilibacillus boraciitolerans JCM 21714 TaxID=1298598 RepID=W4VK59_9BACI|nr:hypothetical protein [Gracilibacillus boraciitolerans]GAE93208.1 hypothetical protein JCM21714_2262 [Gracilibacillus boraciitolerans JCM 21714]